MATERVTRVGALGRLNGGVNARATRIGVLARIAKWQLRSTQAGALARIAPRQVLSSQVGVLVRVQYVEPEPSDNELDVTQVGALARLHQEVAVLATQAGALARLNGGVNLHSTQAGALARFALLQLRATQIAVVVRLSPPPPPPNGGESGAGTAVSAGSGASSAGAAGAAGSGGSSAGAAVSAGGGGSSTGAAGAAGGGGSSAGAAGAAGSGGSSTGAAGAAGSGGSSAGAAVSAGGGGSSTGAAGAAGGGGSSAGAAGAAGSGGSSTGAAGAAGSGGSSTGAAGAAGSGGSSAGAAVSAGGGGSSTGAAGAAGSGGSSTGAAGAAGSGGSSGGASGAAGSGGSSAGAAGAAQSRGATVNGAPATSAQVAAALASAAPGQPAPSPNYTFTAEVATAAGIPLLLQNRLQLTPTAYSAIALGGPDTAQITVAGDRNALATIAEWLGYQVTIRNPSGRIVWHGFVHEITLRYGAVSLTFSMEELYNRIAVAWTNDNDDGAPQRGQTTWIDDASSQAAYGIRELLLDLADSSAAQAAAYAATELASRAQPSPQLTIDSPGAASGILNCRGWWHRLDWQYYADDTGRQLADADADIEHTLGYVRSATTIGFKADKLHDLDARLGELAGDQIVTVSGAANSGNNGQLTIDSAPRTTTPTVYTATTIYFDPADDIMDSANGLEIFTVGEMLRVSGATETANNASRFIKTQEDGGGRLEATPGTVVAESAGATVTLQQGHSVTVQRTGQFTVEGAGATVTLTPLGSKLAQRFQLSASSGWTVRQAAIRARRIGSPADLRISIYSNSGGAPNTQLCTAVVDAADVPTKQNWVLATFATGAALALATDYWIVVEVDGGATDDADYYAIGLDSDLSDTGGVLRNWTGSAWAARTPDADMPYQLWGMLTTGAQIEQMLTGSGIFDAVAMRIDSSTVTRQYRAGDQRLRSELERLLAIGDDDSAPIIATVLPGRTRVAVIAPEPSADDYILLDSDGNIAEAQRMIWEPGVLPVGRWVRITDTPLPARRCYLYITQAEYDIASGAMRLLPRYQPSPWRSQTSDPAQVAQQVKPYLVSENP